MVVIAALVTLGLAAAGLLASQNGILPALPIAAAPTASLDQGKNAPAAAPAPGSPVCVAAVAAPASTASPSVAPVSQVPSPAAPERQNTAGPTPGAATATGTASATDNIALCDKPGGMGLSRIVEIDTTGGPGFGFEQAIRFPAR